MAGGGACPAPYLKLSGIEKECVEPPIPAGGAGTRAERTAPRAALSSRGSPDERDTWAETTAPDELTTIANVMSAPPMPFLPEELVRQTVLMGLMTWAGGIEQGHEVMNRFRALAEPLADFVDEMPYPAIYQGEDEDYHPTAVALNGFTEMVGAEKIDAAIAAIDASDAPLSVVQIRLLGGAVAAPAGTSTTLNGVRGR